MQIRRAEEIDMERINALLRQVLAVHHNGRPDLFREEGKKYSDEELRKLLSDDNKPIFVATEEEKVVGYAFCAFVRHENDSVLNDGTSLYIDYLCVDETSRGTGIGKALFSYVKNFAKEQNCDSLTLNVWECNPSAKRFYEKCGLKPYKTSMELVL